MSTALGTSPDCDGLLRGVVRRFKSTIGTTVPISVGMVAAVAALLARSAVFVLSQWQSARTVPARADATLVDVIAEQVAAHPDICAIRFGGLALSYRQLWRICGSTGVPKGVAVPHRWRGGRSGRCPCARGSIPDRLHGAGCGNGVGALAVDRQRQTRHQALPSPIFRQPNSGPR